MIAPKIPLVRDEQILSTKLVNSMIGRIEYAADLLRQYKLIAGDEMYVEPHFDGTRVSYLQPVAGGATPTKTSTKTYSIPWNTRSDLLGQLYKVSLDGTAFPPSSWSTLLNLYAVWITPGIGYPSDAGINFTYTYKINFDQTTFYKISASADNFANIYLDDVLIISDAPQTGVSTQTIEISSGIHYVKTVARNTDIGQPLWINNPGGWAVLIDYA